MAISTSKTLTTTLEQQYQVVRRRTEEICAPLEIEDYGLQSMPDASPPKWHLAHTTWFFETFILLPHGEGYDAFHPRYGYLFNSYYEAMGVRHPRPQRGLLSRPTVEDVYQYRAYVDDHILAFLRQAAMDPALIDLIRLGLHHEQQHQELLLTDLKHGFHLNPLLPAYREDLAGADHVSLGQTSILKPLGWVGYVGGVHELGAPEQGFAFDNERPRHAVYLQDFSVADRLVTNGEYLEFIEAGGYQNPAYWLAEGWMTVQSEQWQAPLYWEYEAGRWWIMSLGGRRWVCLDEPVCHVSFYEADAYARWAGVRLPTEAEWEVAAQDAPIQGNFAEEDRFHPMPLQGQQRPAQLFGDVWEWTQSAYLPYPGFSPAPGAVGEYNGKFMCNQMVLRGGSCVTSQSHIRASYRNFFYPGARWQFSGIRLAKDGMHLGSQP
ncbi:ergothioneine biosynthesis protein EgtB [Synechococcales cyanobacterium C]|uniref:Ergothioneine biosynthesis protein EgtB n=1 Tax=Petrachloros mirabilis ULC683 TaxID=2781853 RepID=A0A8K1ZX63_9CYAN|nr:ergothioneine biosynthesis protein EgtB [Petrachloros mirabilis]NCJ05746.1 ergothioneine biosynthesis protein EgtB [Petrachloros mirabilis ULC683]